jgi:tRNA threonylcarbamoyladenosine biosynthesis protein TsaB
MKILAIRTDKPEAELYLYEDNKQIAQLKWQAHRQLAKTIHLKLQEIFNPPAADISLAELDGIVVFKGPGSFTGLRIGMSLANTLAYAQNIPIVATSGKDWMAVGIIKLQKGKSDKIAVPKYSTPAAITQPKK